MTCKVCSPRKCAASYLYVVRDARLGLTKIGRSVNVAQRMASYRANGADYITREHKRVAGCDFTASDREAKALRLLAARAPRVRGDWFDCDPSLAIECVEAACAGYAGARWQ